MKAYDTGLKGDGVFSKRVCTAKNLSDQNAMMERYFSKFREFLPALK